MNILVIGNGFDLAHGLKTSYKDFLEACNKMSIQDVTEGKPDYKNMCKTNLWMKHFITRQKQLGDTWIDLENEIYKVIQFIKDQTIITGSGLVDQVCPQLLSINPDVKHFNFNEIINHLSKPKQEYKTTVKGYAIHNYENDSNFNVYIYNSRGFVNFLYNQLREFTSVFETYLIKEVCEKANMQLDCNLYLEPIKEQLPYQNCYILSFNYTDICERLYEQNLGFYQAIIKSVYVHGKINKDEVCNLVLGTHSFDNTYKSNPMSHRIPVYFNVFKKHNQRHRYGTIEAYQDLLNNLKLPSETRPVFYVIGHSLDKTDHNILKHVFLANKNAVINIYYHDEEAQERLINNITEIIGEEEVMSKVRLIYQHDEKRGLLRKTKSLVQSAP